MFKSIRRLFRTINIRHAFKARLKLKPVNLVITPLYPRYIKTSFDPVITPLNQDFV